MGARRQGPAGATDGDLAGQATIDLRVQGVAEPQLDPGAQDVAQRGSQVRPPGRGDGEVDPVAEAALGHLQEHRLEVGEVGTQHGPLVDDQQHVAPTGTGVEPWVGSVRGAGPCLPRVGDGPCLGDDASDELGLGAPGHRGDVRQSAERDEPATAEVEDQHPQLLRSVGQRQRRDEGRQGGRPPGPRTPHDRDVPGLPGQVGREDVVPLLAGAVDDTEREGQPPSGPPRGRDETEPVGPTEVRQEVAERRRAVRGCQPDRARARGQAAQHADHDVEDRGADVHLAGRDESPHRGRRRPVEVQWGQPERPEPRPVGRAAGAPRAGLVGRAEAAHDGRRGGSRDVRRVEAGGLVGAGAQVARPGGRRQRVGVTGPDDGAGLGGREGAQRDPEGQVTVEAAEPSLLEALRGEQQVQTQGPAQAPHGDEEVDQLGPDREELGELVDDDEQARHRGEVGPTGPAGGLVLVS